MNETISSAIAISSLVGAFIGYLAAVATFRAQFAVVDSRHEALVRQIDRDRKADAELLKTRLEAFTDVLDRIDSRQLATLRLAADLARANGVKHRALGEDVLARYLSEDDVG